MSNFVQIPSLPAGISLSGTEQFEAVQSGVSVQLNANQIAAYIQAGFAGVTTFAGGATGLTPVGPVTGAITLAGTLKTTFGGTGLAAYTTGDLLYASATNVLSRLPIGSNGQILSLVAGLPTWVTDSTVSVSTFSGGTTGLTPNTPTIGAIVLAGTLIAANGGTGQSSYAVGDLLYASGATALSKLAGVATGNALISGGVTTAPVWGKIGLTTHVSGVLPAANGGTGVANASTITLGGNFAMSGAFTFTGTVTGNTAVTFPTSGTLATTASISTALPSATTSQLYVGSGAAGAATVVSTLPTAAFPALTGDITTAGGALATTLAIVATGATTGSSTAIPVVTFNNKGLVTAITTAAVIAPAGTLTGATLAAGVTASSLTSVGTLSSLTLGGALTYGGVTLTNAVTGTGSMVLSASPTLTGTLTAASGTFGTNLTIDVGASASISALLLSQTGANGANFRLTGDGVTTPSKTIRVSTGVFQILNNAYSAAILGLTDAGALSVSTSIAAGTTLQTAAPAGASAGAWKLGSLVTAGVVLDTTRSVYVDIGGTVYKLLVAQ